MTKQTAFGQRGLGRLTGPPLIVQLIGLLVGALVAAQLVTLTLTVVLPPSAPREYRLADIAAALAATSRDDGRFDRVIQSGPPDLSARGWFVSESARNRLASLLGQPLENVALGFYTQLPVGGAIDAVAPSRRLPADAERQRPVSIGAFGSGRSLPPVAGGNVEIAFSGERGVRLIDAALQQLPVGPPGGGFPGGGPPGGGFPGGGFPGGGFPQSLPHPPTPTTVTMRPQAQTTAPSAPTQTKATSGSAATQSAAQPTSVSGAATPANQVVTAGQPIGGLFGSGNAPLTAGGLPVAPLAPPPSAQIENLLQPTPRSSSAARRTSGSPLSGSGPGVGSSTVFIHDPNAFFRSIDGVAAAQPSSADRLPAWAGKSPYMATQQTTSPIGRPVPIVRPARGFLSLAPAPFVEGDFIAGVRFPDGRWVVVSPRAEGFPNAWQRRVALWFLLSLLAVAPVAWLFARRIVGPLNDFACAADLLGRDPGAAVLPLNGPAEIGRAAHAFNQMQSRLRSFVDDRTAMIGAISHDLRTPLTRLRFRIEEVPEEQQDDLRGEVAEMEAMISSVIDFMRDASIPNARERRDLAEIVDDVVEDATLLGDVRADLIESAIVDVDTLGIRRVLNNLLTNALKYGGGQARVALRVERDCAVAEIVDSGPGVPESELERLFEPFYRSEAARTSDREGSGLGLAVCRSIARAHGGDVALFRAPGGFTARVTLPLAFEDAKADARRAA